jgi:hypothetical protein
MGKKASHPLLDLYGFYFEKLFENGDGREGVRDMGIVFRKKDSPSQRCIVVCIEKIFGR